MMAAHRLAFQTPRGGGKSDPKCAKRRATLRSFRTSSRAACGGLAPRPAFAEAKLRLRAGRRNALLAGNLATPSYGYNIDDIGH